MKFTKEEVSLCKQVAERHRKSLTDGCLVLGTYLSGEEFVGHFYEELAKNKLASIRPTRLDEIMVGFCTTAKTTTPIIPLWTISNCLEFLREKGFTIVQACEHPMSNEWIVEVNPYFSNAVKIMGHKSFDVRGDTILEACLKAVLTVLEESE